MEHTNIRTLKTSIGSQRSNISDISMRYIWVFEWTPSEQTSYTSKTSKTFFQPPNFKTQRNAVSYHSKSFGAAARQHRAGCTLRSHKAAEHVVLVKTLSIPYSRNMEFFLVVSYWHRVNGQKEPEFPGIAGHCFSHLLTWRSKTKVSPWWPLWLFFSSKTTHHDSVPPDSSLWPPAVKRSPLELWCWRRPLATELFYAKISLQKWCVLFIFCLKMDSSI